MMSSKLTGVLNYVPKRLRVNVTPVFTRRMAQRCYNFNYLYFSQMRGFARAKLKRDIKSKEVLQQITEKMSLEAELQSYEFKIDYAEVKNLENILTSNGVFSFFNNNNPAQMHPIFKVHVLGKLIKCAKEERLNIEMFTKTEEFKSLYTSLKLGVSKMDAKGLSNFLIHCASLNIQDNEVLEYAKHKIISGNFRQINPQDLSNFLFAFGLTNFKDQELIENIVSKLEDDQPFNIFVANRNLFALSRLDFYNEKLFNKIEQVLHFKKDLIGEGIVTNYLQSLSKFDHISEKTKSILSREIIEKVGTYKYSSIATICTSMVKLNWNHKIMLDILKNEILKRFKEKEIELIAAEIKPIEITQMIVAYTHFNEFDSTILTLLEQVYMRHIEEAKGEETVALVISHANWARDMLKYDYDECPKSVRRKAKKNEYMLNRLEKYFKRYNSELIIKVLDNLIQKKDNINSKAIFLVLANLNSINIKKNSAKRKVVEFAIEGLHIIKRDCDIGSGIETIRYK